MQVPYATSIAFDPARYCQLQQLLTDPLLFLAYNQPGYDHRKRPVVKHHYFTYPENLKFRVEHYEKADPHT
jgi:hypothetical protein